MNMTQRILDFQTQAEQMLDIIEGRLQQRDRATALQLLILKFKSLYEQGVASGKLYAREGVYPFMSLDE
jgi:hypothetical protein